jgi:hypothetical protein
VASIFNYLIFKDYCFRRREGACARWNQPLANGLTPQRQLAASRKVFCRGFRQVGSDQLDGARRIMTFGYAQPFSFQIGDQSPLSVVGVRHGVTEITLSDGRRVRVMLHVKGVSPSTKQPGAFDISYDIVTEVIDRPDVTILDVHETVQ